MAAFHSAAFGPSLYESNEPATELFPQFYEWKNAGMKYWLGDHRQRAYYTEISPAFIQ